MGWLDDYLQYTEHQESPTDFHLWTGLTILAATLGRRAWLDRRSHGVTRYRIYPGQLMTVLVGPSGTQKSTATDIGVKNFFNRLENVHVIMDKITPEKILKRLANLGTRLDGTRVVPCDSVALVYADELSVLLNRASYADPMSDIIIKLYNAQSRQEYDSVGGGLIVLRNVCVTILATTTPIGLGESVSSKSHSTGYMARVHHVYGERTQKVNALTDLDDEEVDAVELRRVGEIETSLLARLSDYQKIEGPFRYSKDGKQYFDDYYHEWRRNPRSLEEGWFTRRHDHMLRLAMLFRVSSHGDKTITSNALDQADKALLNIEADHAKAFQCIGQSQHAKLQDRIVAAIVSNGGRISGPLLVSRVRRYIASIQELKDAIAALGDSGDIVRSMEGNVDYYVVGNGEGR